MIFTYTITLFLIILLLLRFLYLPKKKKYIDYVKTDFGYRKNSPLILEKDDETLIIVTNPVGTSRIGNNASQLAIDIVKKKFETTEVSINVPEFLKKACFLAHRGVSEGMNFNSGGCSFALIHIHKKQLHYASVGDIGIYLYQKELRQLNQFDLYKYQLRNQVLDQKISEEKLMNNRFKNELTAYLGHENLRKVTLIQAPIILKKNNQLIIATNDVHQTVTQLQIEKILKKKPRHKLEQKMQQLTHLYHNQKQINPSKSSTPSTVIASKFK